MALIDALRMIAEPLKHLIDRVGRRVDDVERDIADVGDKVDFIHATAPIVQTASVGQTVVVKAVDESGKPTEWEAKDMSGSAGGDTKAFIIWSYYTEDYDGNRTAREHRMNFTYDEAFKALTEHNIVPVFYWFVRVDCWAMNDTGIEYINYKVDRITSAIASKSVKYPDEDGDEISLRTSFSRAGDAQHYLNIKADGTLEVDDWQNM